MTTEVTRELQKDLLRANFTLYTRKAFQMLPELDTPSILDIGCGTGVPTLELARLSNGPIIGLDIDQALLNELERKIAAEVKGLQTESRRRTAHYLRWIFPMNASTSFGPRARYL